HKSTVTGLVFSDDSKTLGSCGLDNYISVWKVENGDEIHHFGCHDEGMLCLALAPGGELMATGSKDGTVRLWKLPQRKEVFKLGGDGGAVWAVAFAADGKQLVTAGDGGS